MTPAAIRWLKRPRPVKHYYACDKCKVTHVNYVDTDLCVVWHWCRYRTPGGRDMEVERELTLQ